MTDKTAGPWRPPAEEDGDNSSLEPTPPWPKGLETDRLARV